MKIEIIEIFTCKGDQIMRVQDDRLGIDIGQEGGHGRGDRLRSEKLRSFTLSLDPTHSLIVGALGARALAISPLWGNQPPELRFRLGQVHT